MQELKKCNVCFLDKTNFARKSPICRECRYNIQLAKKKILYKQNRKEKLLYQKEYYLKNKNKIEEYRKSYYKKNRNILILKQKQRNFKYNRSFYLKNYRKNNKVKFKIYAKTRRAKLISKLRSNISNSIYQALKQNSSSKHISCFKCLGYSTLQLKQHIESKFEFWMSWSNWGGYNPNTWNDAEPSTWTWNIDHIIPQSDLPYISMEDENFKICWSLSNIRPYSAKLNCLDGATKIRNKGNIKCLKK